MFESIIGGYQSHCHTWFFSASFRLDGVGCHRIIQKYIEEPYNMEHVLRTAVAFGLSLRVAGCYTDEPLSLKIAHINISVKRSGKLACLMKAAV